MTCPKCGAAVQPYDRFCIRCGHDMQPTGAGASATGRSQSTQPIQSTSTYNGSAGTYTAPTPPASGWQSSPGGTTPGQPYDGSTGQPPYGGPAPQGQGPFGNWTPGQQGQGTPGAGGAGWASGSSTPGANPYASTPSTVSNGTMLNGRPANAGGKGLFQGIGAAVVAFFVILGKFGGAIAALGIFKFLFYWWLFSGLLHAGLGTLVLVIVVVLIVGGIARSRGMV